MHRFTLALAAIASLGAGYAAAQSSAMPDGACTALGNAVMTSAHVTSARVTPATDTLPVYCEVRATALPAISIEVRLPMEGWNGRYYQTGCGGFCGILGRADASAGWINAMRPGLERGYATATSDSGHHGLSVVDATWAASNPQGERDWGWRSIGETHRVANALIEAFYGRAQERAIFQGCSTGGRMANMAALRYPTLFQGIISGAPALDYPGLVATKMSWLMQTNDDPDGNQIITHEKVGLIGDATMAACDGIDGTVDGVIADPRQCTADLADLACTGADDGQCLTDAELGVLQAWRDGPVNGDGEQLYPGGVPAGSEPFWWLWLTGNEAGAGRTVAAFTNNFAAYMAFDEDPGADWHYSDFDFDMHPEMLETAAETYNSDDPDLSAFREAGGKMIVWHGWADAIVTPFKTVEWYEQASAAAGGEDVLEENVTLFMVPGLDHCGILPGPGGINQASLDPMTPLEAWLDGGPVPTSIMAE